MRARSVRRAVLAAAGLLATAAAVRAAEPVRALLLDYNAPSEHDVLLSHLCVERCTADAGCPEELLKDGVDYWSEDFVIYRPRYLGRSARFVVDVYKDRRIDLVSFSGHHASGFSGDFGRGRFDTERLATNLFGSARAERFFTAPSTVLFHGCRTDVKSKFDGDPEEYVLHVIEETTVREDQLERLLAAVQQIGGVQQAYRDLFPNACLLGYRGTQTPGGILEIYRQVTSFMKTMAGRGGGPGRFTDASYQELGRRVLAECPRGWPCNLCEVDEGYYGPLARTLASYLRRERGRIHGKGERLSEDDVIRREALFEEASYYANTRWSCSSYEPGTAPVWPDPVDESPFARLFLRLLWVDLGNLQPEQRRELREELVHRLGTIAFAEIDRIELRAWLYSDEGWSQLEDFFGVSMRNLSTFRQKDFFSFLANIHCSRCLELVFDDGYPSLLRENAAGRFVAALGPDLYRRALADADPRVRLAAARRLDPALGWDVILEAAANEDPDVRREVWKRFGAVFLPPL